MVSNVRFTLHLAGSELELELSGRSIWEFWRAAFWENWWEPVSAWDVGMLILKREGRAVSYHVDVSTRNGRGEPIRAAVRTDEGRFAVVCRRTVFGWEPLYGLDLNNGADRELPACFKLHPDALRALELAL